MDLTQQGIILLLKSAITGESYELPPGFTMENAGEIIEKHAIIPPAFFGASNCGIRSDLPAMQKLMGAYCKLLYLHESQMYDLNRICEAFEENGIDYMPVKGCNMKGLYPQPDLRVMGDADILIKKEQYDTIRKIMLETGFEFDMEGDHDYAWTSPNLHVELHYLLIPPYNRAYESYFGNGWKLAAEKNGFRYRMTKEDEFIYLFVHFTKHYRIGGIGCRHMLDLWVYLRSCPDLDFSYIERIFKKLDLLTFWKNIRKLLRVWFEEEEPDELTELMTTFIFDSGAWGTEQSRAMSKGVEAKQREGSMLKGRLKIFQRAAFPPREILAYRYGILKKLPFLLPFLWVWRWFDAAFHRRENFKAYTREVKLVMKSDISEFEKNFRKMGIDFKFEERKK